MTWVDLLNAFRTSTEILVQEDSIITVNGSYKDKDGYYIETSSDSHTICMKLAGEYAKYSVNVKVDRNNQVTSVITIKDVGEFHFPITEEGENFMNRVNITPGLSEFRQDKKLLCELEKVFDWINKICSGTIRFE